MQTEVVLNNQRIWAPWRAEYILDESKNDSCVFCKVTNSTNNDDNKRLLVLRRGSFSFVIMNKYPYNPGHLMVVPYKHATYFDDLSSEIISEMIQLKIRSINALRNAMNPEGFNIAGCRCRRQRPSSYPYCSKMEWRHKFYACFILIKGNIRGT